MRGETAGINASHLPPYLLTADDGRKSIMTAQSGQLASQGRQAERKVIEAALQRFSPGVEGKTSCDRTGDQYCHVIPKDKTIRFIKPFFLTP
jgi:hypothetical protein